MPLPGNITLVEVRADYVGFDGLPVTGEVRFTPTASRAADNDALTTLIGRTITGTLTTTVVVTVDEETEETYNYSVGRLSVTLPATDDPELVPFEFTYRVTEDFEGGADGYYIAVPVASAADGVDLTLVADIGPSGGIGNQVLVPGPTGPAGGVTSVDGETGAVDLSDTYVPAVNVTVAFSDNPIIVTSVPVNAHFGLVDYTLLITHDVDTWAAIRAIGNIYVGDISTQATRSVPSFAGYLEADAQWIIDNSSVDLDGEGSLVLTLPTATAFGNLDPALPVPTSVQILGTAQWVDLPS